MNIHQKVVYLSHERSAKIKLCFKFAFLILFAPTFYLSPLHAQTSLPADSTGFLLLESNHQSTFFAVINNDFSNPIMIETRDSLSLSPGIYDILILKKLHRDVAFKTRIESNKVNRYGLNFRRLQISKLPDNKHLSSYPRLHLQAKNAVRTDHDTEIYFNGDLQGTGFAPLNGDNRENAELTFVANSGKVVKKELIFDENDPFELHEYFLRPRQATSIIYSFVPGLSQFYKKQNLKAGIIIGSQIAFSMSAYLFHRKMNSKFSDLKVVRTTYTQASDPERVLQLANQMEQLDREVNRNFKVRNSFIGAGIALYVLNVLDGALRTDDGFHRKISFDPYFDLSENSASLQMSVNF